MAKSPLYTVRAAWEGAILSDLTGGDWESAKEAYDALEKFYLNVPDATLSEGVTLQLFAEADGTVVREVTFP